MKIKKVYQINMGILIVHAILLILSMMLKFINMTDGTINLSLSQISGFPFVFIGLLLNIILLIRQNIFIFLSFLISIAGYTYSFYYIFNFLSKIDEGINGYITYGIGYYSYIISFLLLMMNIVIFTLISVNEKIKSK